MSTYNFRLDRFRIDNTRARHTDTDFVTIGLKVGDITYPTQTTAMGDLNNGTYGVGLSFSNVPVDASDTPVIFNFQILNSGHKTQQDIDNALTNGASKLASTGASALGDLIIPGTGSIWAVAASKASEWLAGILFANCDGPVAIDQVAINGATLDAWTAPKPHVEDRFYPGTNSAHGCGSNSEYHVLFTFEHVAGTLGDRPCGYVTGGTGQHVVYRANDGHIYELFIDATSNWVANQLTGAANAPAAAGRAMAYVTGGTGQHVVYRANDGHIYELFVNATGNWVARQLTGAASAPLAAGDPSAYVTDGTGQHVVYRASDGHIYELFIDATGNWVANQLTGAESSHCTR
jgi:hypothetical protein